MSITHQKAPRMTRNLTEKKGDSEQSRAPTAKSLATAVVYLLDPGLASWINRIDFIVLADIIRVITFLKQHLQIGFAETTLIEFLHISKRSIIYSIYNIFNSILIN